jgi:hypothetical protein
MAGDSGKRNFALRDADGEETSVFSGNSPRQAALKAARRLDPAEDRESAEEHRAELRLREKGSDKVHVYEAWAWRERAPADKPDWMPAEITEANVRRVGVEHGDE